MTLRLDDMLDLGRDADRVTPADRDRQVATTNCLLRAFSAPFAERREVQLLADEVGLGKTFVALATAYSLLRVVRTEQEWAGDVGLGKCYRAVVVVVPYGNNALARKWHQEVEALRTRCSTDPKETEWFHSRICENAYDLVEGLRRASDLRRNPRKNPCVLICTANVFSKRVSNLGARLRFLAACLFRWWGNKLNIHERYRLVKRAEGIHGFSDWAGCARRVRTDEYEANLWDFTDHEKYLDASEGERQEWSGNSGWIYEQIPFRYGDIGDALDSLMRTDDGRSLIEDETLRTRDGYEEPKGLLPYCKDAADRKGYAEWYFHGFKTRLLDLYKELAHHLIRQDIPLIVVDEAHHWRHTHRQDCEDFRTRLAPIARRLLLLTATPFQLHRDELLDVLSVGDAMEPAIGEERVRRLQELRELIRKATADSETAGVAFSREWGALPEQFAMIDARFDPGNGIVPGTTDPRTGELARLWADAPTGDSDGAEGIPGPLRPFFARARELKASNERLRTAMRTLIIRHRRSVTHRRILIGREYPADDNRGRPDQHLLHLAPGAVIPPEAELAQYLLMKVVADATRGKHRTTLGIDLTGCYTTLWQSKEGGKAEEAATTSNNKGLFQLLQRLTGHRTGKENSKDHQHPKLRLVVDEVLRRWDHGEKSLIFCFRVPTAKTLARLLAEGVESRLARSRRNLLALRGTQATDEQDVTRAMTAFRGSLTAREGSGVQLFLDRVLLGWLQEHGLPLPALTAADRRAVSELYARARTAGGPLFRGGERPRIDRVFLNRAIDHVWAARLLTERALWRSRLDADALARTESLLEEIAAEDWVRFRYGDAELSGRKVETEGATGPTDAVARSSLAHRYTLDGTSADGAADAVEAALTSLGERVASGPNLLVPLGPETDFLAGDARERVGRMRRLLFAVSHADGQWQWAERAKVLDAILVCTQVGQEGIDLHRHCRHVVHYDLGWNGQGSVGESLIVLIDLGFTGGPDRGAVVRRQPPPQRRREADERDVPVVPQELLLLELLERHAKHHLSGLLRRDGLGVAHPGGSRLGISRCRYVVRDPMTVSSE